jgi:DNA-binding LacI/PurR family transcriptional regulator
MTISKYKEIASVAGVSPASVTRFFDKKTKVRPETEDKIVEALKNLGMSMPVSQVIGLIIPDSNNPHFTSIAFEFEKEFERRGWHLLISNSEGKLDRELEIIERYKGLGISGLIYINSGVQSDGLYSSLIANNYNLPVLSFDRPIDSRTFDYVIIDSKNGTLQSVDYLVTKGHQRIAYLKGLKGTMTAAQRYESFVEAMSANRLKIAPEHEFEGNYSYGTGVECADRLIEMKIEDRPTAIICANDLMAIGLMHQLQVAGWRLPEQLSVIGFDNIPMSEWAFPSLTTIAQPIRILVSNAANMLLKRITAVREEKVLPQQISVVTPMLIPRDSVASPFTEKRMKILSIKQ